MPRLQPTTAIPLRTTHHMPMYCHSPGETPGPSGSQLTMPRAMVVVLVNDSSAASAAKKRFVPPQAAAHRRSAARHASGLLFGDKAGT